MAASPLLTLPFLFLLCATVACRGKLAQASPSAVHHAVSLAGRRMELLQTKLS